MVKISIIETGSGKCCLSGYEGEGLTAGFENETPMFWTWRSFRQLLALRLAQSGKAPMAMPPRIPANPSSPSEQR